MDLCGQLFHVSIRHPSQLSLKSDLSGFADRNEAVLVIQNYYKNIDENSYDHVLGLFDESASYLRSARLFDGKKSIRNFYENVRTLEGKHKILTSTVMDDHIMVMGEFIGTANGQVVHLQFIDVWWFKANSQVVIFRESQIYKNGVEVAL